MRFTRTLAAAFLLAASTLAAHAATIFDFTFTNGTDVVTFSLPSSPSPDLVNADPPIFTLNAVPVGINGLIGAYTITFFKSVNLGGLCISTADAYCNSGAILNLAGPELYTGDLTTPTFTLGSYDLNSVDSGKNTLTGNFHLTIAEQMSPVPEPSTFALLGTGLLAAAGAVRRKFIS